MSDVVFDRNLLAEASYAPRSLVVALTAGSTSSGGTRVPSVMPAAIPADQTYYWSFAWQEDIRESMAALRSGEFEDFDSDDPNDVVRWLLRDDDEA